MKGHRLVMPLTLCVLLATALFADQPAVTVYNQNFGVVHEKITLDLQAGVNQVRFTDITARVEPDSVILRDPTGQHRLQILEQNYRADPLSQELLLSLFEGKTIDFWVHNPTDPDRSKSIRGKIIRSGYDPQARGHSDRDGCGQPIIELDGKLQFGLPGTPVFPSLGEDTILEPALNWVLESDAAGRLEAELSYVTGGMSWEADYNLMAPGAGDVLELVGWVTIDNQTGRTFEDAQVKLMAGDLSKLQPQEQLYAPMLREGTFSVIQGLGPVREKTFDEYHLYTLQRSTTLHDRETKQIEFIRAAGIQAHRAYVYDGVKFDRNSYEDTGAGPARRQSDFGTQCNPKVWVMCEFKNSTDNHLGMPLPAGRLRLYRDDADARLEFIGENEIDHTPKDELVRIYTGNAFDLVGERRRTEFKIDTGQNWLDESFEVQVRNHKNEPVEVRVVEHLYRGNTWEIREESQDYEKKDAQTIEFRVTVPPDGEQSVTYAVHYSW